MVKLRRIIVSFAAVAAVVLCFDGGGLACGAAAYDDPWDVPDGCSFADSGTLSLRNMLWPGDTCH